MSSGAIWAARTTITAPSPAAKSKWPARSSATTPGPLAYLTDDQGDEYVDFIRRHKERPFFLFTSFAAPHSPMQATEEDLKCFAHIEDRLRRTYCAMVYRLDQNVGKILHEVCTQGIEHDTFVVFRSDNGGPSAPRISNGSVNAPFRGSKTTVLEGGSACLCSSSGLRPYRPAGRPI